MALLLGPPPFQCAAHDYRSRRSLKLKRKTATTDWELLPSQPVVAAYHVMLSRSYRETIIKSQHLCSISASLIRSHSPLDFIANPVVSPPLAPSQAPPPPRARP